MICNKILPVLMGWQGNYMEKMPFVYIDIKT